MLSEMGASLSSAKELAHLCANPANCVAVGTALKVLKAATELHPPQEEDSRLGSPQPTPAANKAKRPADKGEHIYVLELRDGCRYVGKSDNVARRIREHREGIGSGCEWTKLHPPVEEVDMITDRGGDASASERAETLRQMNEHGIDKVRGGPWCAVYLTEEHKREIVAAIRDQHGLCYTCGTQSHLASACPKISSNKRPRT